MTPDEAVIAAREILKDEANELACLQTDPVYKPLPHRAKVAIQIEIRRLREIADNLQPAESVSDK